VAVTGTVINALAIVAAGFLGLLLRKGVPENMNRTMQDGLGLLIMVIGIQYGFKADNLAVVGLSLAFGAIIGEWRQWEARLEIMGMRLEKRFGNGDSHFVKGFVSATLLFCVGAMAVVGSLENGLTGNYQILLVKSMLDGIFSLLFAASMGVGVLFSAVPVFIYQGSISLGAGVIKPLLTDPMLNNITALGGILIAGLGFNIMGITRIRVANLLPGIILVPLLMTLLKYLPR
jgi:uncharacterized membrane protein YqgA involved in biofilm formation